MLARCICSFIFFFLLSPQLLASTASIDLRGNDWSPGYIHNLQANWDLYWEQLLLPSEINAHKHEAIIFPVPGAWTSPHDGIQALPGFGFGTYRVEIIVPPETTELFLFIPDMASAYKLWSNGELVSFNGVVGKNKVEEKPAYLPKVVSVLAENGKIELVLQTSNFHYKWGGVWYNLKLTDESGVYDLREKPIILAMLFSTLLLSASLFSLFMFASRPKEKVLLYFGLFCFTMGLRRLLTDERILYMFDWLSWPVLQALENLCIYLAFPLFVCYFSYRFPVRFSKRACRLSWLIATPFCVLALVTDVSFYTQFNVPFQILLLASVPYILFTYVKALVAGKRGAPIFGLGLLIFLVTVINDILTYSYIIHTPNLAHLGTLAFVVFQAVDLLKSYLYNFATIQKMSKTLKRRNQELVRIDSFKDEFLATTSHELRTPLHGISGLAAHLKQDNSSNLTNDQCHKLDLIASTTTRLGTLVNDILDFSSIKHGNLTLTKKRVDLQALADVVINTLSPLLVGRDIRLSTQIAPDARYIQADENRLQQILFNLLGNSVKFTEDGFIQLNAKREKNLAIIEIVDTGMGISPDKHDLLFQPFEYINDTSEQTYSGTGLGLSISRQLIEMHEGELTIDSREGYGTTVCFDLPLANMADSGPSEGLSEPKISNTEMAFNTNTSTMNEREKYAHENSTVSNPYSVADPYTAEIRKAGLLQQTVVFVVDDEEVNRELVKAQLFPVGYHVECFIGGATLLDRLTEKTPDLVLLDLMMPNMNGLEVCKKIRQHQDRYELPIMMLTARYQTSDIVDCLNAGANDYLVKPYHEKELLARVHSQLSTRQFWFSNKENQLLKSEIHHRKALSAQLSTANTRLLQALDISDECIMLLDNDLRIIYANQNALTFFSSTEKEIVGSKITSTLSEEAYLELQKCVTDESIITSFTVHDSYLGSAISCIVNRFNERGESYLAMVLTSENSAATDLTGTPLSSDVLKDLTREISESKQKFARIEEVLKQVTSITSIAEKDPAESTMPNTDATSHSVDNRELLVRLLRETLSMWERYTNKTKIDLAEESRCWRVYIDGTTAKTRTLDRYLSVRTLPEKPRWRLAVRTANFVIDNCNLNSEDYDALSALIELLDDAYA